MLFKLAHFIFTSISMQAYIIICEKYREIKGIASEQANDLVMELGKPQLTSHPSWLYNSYN